jgi:hypothetical protein
MFGFAVAGIVPCMVLGVLLSRHIGIVVAIVIAHGRCGCCLRGAWVLRPPSLQCMGVAAVIIMVHGCCGHCCRGMWVLRLPSSRHMGVAVAIVAPCGCCGYCRHAAQGVAGAVIAVNSGA